MVSCHQQVAPTGTGKRNVLPALAQTGPAKYYDQAKTVFRFRVPKVCHPTCGVHSGGWADAAATSSYCRAGHCPGNIAGLARPFRQATTESRPACFHAGPTQGRIRDHSRLRAESEQAQR
jgi:hypothetical protein